MARVFIGLGSNLGDRLANLSRAAQRLAREPGVRVLRMSPILETEAVGGPPQGPYLNAVLELDTEHDPRALLGLLKAIEQQLGRAPSAVRWAPRPIDLDLLLYEDRVVEEPDLRIPHPRLHTRWFVLEPLAQLAPGLTHPVLGARIDTLRDRVAPTRPPDTRPVCDKAEA